MRKFNGPIGASPMMRLLPSGRDGDERFSARQRLSPILTHILEEVQRELGYERAGRDDERPVSSREVETAISKIAERLGFELSSFERDEILAVVEREQRPFGILQALVDDPQVSDIIITNYQRVCIQQGRKNIVTDLSFPSADAYESFVERLLQRADATYSTKKPIADGMIGAFARIHAVHKSICESGPYLTIRLNRFSQVTLQDLLAGGLAPHAVLGYLRGLVRNGLTVLIVGEVGTGKTTLARALAGSVPEAESILVIEDTPEIRLEHPHVRYVTTREANSEGVGRISPSECIRAGMRMAMNRIIFGEMRDAEAAEAFVDVCASGHPGLSTIHARSAAEALVRLELFLGRAQRGVERGVLSEQIATSVQAIVHVAICPVSGKRRIMEVVEIGPVADGVLRQRQMFQYHVRAGQPTWTVVSRVSAHRETLESDVEPVVLSGVDGTLHLPDAVALGEAAQRKAALSSEARGRR